MTKELLTVEFRYRDVKNDNVSYENKTVTVGIYDTIEEAIENGNKILNVLSDKFEVRDKFKLNHLFGFPKRLVTNTCYQKGIEYFAKIEQLKFDNISDIVEHTFEAFKRYKKHVTENTI